jgi:hypothetical protein
MEVNEVSELRVERLKSVTGAAVGAVHSYRLGRADMHAVQNETYPMHAVSATSSVFSIIPSQSRPFCDGVTRF